MTTGPVPSQLALVGAPARRYRMGSEHPEGSLRAGLSQGRGVVDGRRGIGRVVVLEPAQQPDGADQEQRHQHRPNEATGALPVAAPGLAHRTIVAPVPGPAPAAPASAAVCCPPRDLVTISTRRQEGAATVANDQFESPFDIESEVPADAPGRDLALELVRVTEAGAIAAGRWVGRGDKEGADGVAVDAMRALIGTVQMDGIVVIGEGEKDNAPMLYNGERVGDGTGPKCDVAVDPVDGTTLTAKGMPNAVSIMAVAPRGSMYDPSAVFYMDKLVAGPDAADVVDIDVSVAENIRRTAKAKGSSKEDITVCVLDRPRHQELVEQIRATGARIKFILDGDVAGAIMAARPDTGVDLLIGVGGTPEGIITACAMKAIGGVIQARLRPRDDDELQKAIDAGHEIGRVLSTDDLVTGDDCFFVATGITDGELLRGVRYAHFGATTHSLVMRSRSGTVRTITSEHQFSKISRYSSIDFAAELESIKGAPGGD